MPSKTKKFILIHQASSITELEPKVQEEISILQEDGNDLTWVDIRPGLQGHYIATIHYSHTYYDG